MPLRDDIQLNDTELLLHFETNNTILANDLARFLIALDEYVRLRSQFGPGHQLILRRLESGSPMDIVLQVMDHAGDFATVAGFGLVLADRIRSRRRLKVSSTLAPLLDNADVHEFDIVVADETGKKRRITMARDDIPAVGLLPKHNAIIDGRHRTDRIRYPRSLVEKEEGPTYSIPWPTPAGSPATDILTSGSEFGLPIGRPNLVKSDEPITFPIGSISSQPKQTLRVAGEFIEIMDPAHFQFRVNGSDKVIIVEVRNSEPPLATPLVLTVSRPLQDDPFFMRLVSYDILDTL